MRIAFYAPMKAPTHPVPSGDRRLARLLFEALRLAGHEPMLASTFRSHDGRGDPARQLRLAGLGERLAARFLRRSGPVPEAWFTYHLYHKAPDHLGPAVSSALGIPYFLAEASVAPKRAGGPWDLGHRAAIAAIRQADAVFCLNPVDAACLRPVIGDPARLVPLPPFLGAKSYGAPADRAALAARYGLDPAEPWLLAVGMMRPGDKLDSYRALGAALARLGDRPWRLLVAGDGPARADCLAALDPARTVALGALDEAMLRPLYAAADLVVWPAVREAFGMALLEAQASGCPVVAGRVGGVPGIVADSETGLLVPDGDAAAFAAAVASLLDDPARRRAMGQAARARVRARHDLPAAAAAIAAVLRATIRQAA